MLVVSLVVLEVREVSVLPEEDSRLVLILLHVFRLTSRVELVTFRCHQHRLTCKRSLLWKDEGVDATSHHVQGWCSLLCEELLSGKATHVVSVSALSYFNSFRVESGLCVVVELLLALFYQ